MQSPSTRSGMVVVSEQQIVCQTWIWMDIMPCIAKPSRSSPPRLTPYPHADHHLAIARDDRSDHGLALTVLGQEKPGCVPLTPGLQRAIGLSPWRLDVYSVDFGRRVMEHRRAFGRRVGTGEPFERVIHHVIGKGDFVWRKVAFEHAPLRAELLNTE